MDIAVQSGRLTQFDQHDVAVHRAGVVVRVENKLCRHDVLLSIFWLPDVVLPQPNFDV